MQDVEDEEAVSILLLGSDADGEAASGGVGVTIGGDGSVDPKDGG